MRLFILGLLLLSCGPGSNPNQMYVPPRDKERIDALLVKADMAYDRGRLSDARDAAEKAYEINKSNMPAAVSLANIIIEQANLSLLDIAYKIANDLGGVKSSSTAKAADVLGSLVAIVGLHTSDLDLLGTKKTSQNPFFTDLDLYYPHTPGLVTELDSPRFQVPLLRSINQAIEILCPFVSETVTQATEQQRAKCKKVVDSEATNRATVHLTYALAHLFEAVIFNAILTYSNSTLQADNTSSSTSSNLVLRATKLEKVAFSADNATNYFSAVLELVDNVNGVLDITDGTMLTETMADITIAVKALEAISGVPKSLLTQLDAILTNIEKAVTNAGKSKDLLTNKTQALKAQLSEVVVAKLGSSLSSFIGNIPPSQLKARQGDIDKACASYKTLAKNSLQTVTLPAGCT